VEDYERLAVAINAFPNSLARDIGLLNTLTHGVLRRTGDVTAERLRMGTCLDKQAAFDYLSTHAHPCDNALFVKRECGRDFLDRIADICCEIDEVTRIIDKLYSQMMQVRQCLLSPLGLKKGEHISRDAMHPDSHVRHLITQFFVLRDRIRHHKDRRLRLYDKAHAVKRCWFGWLTNREVELALKHNACVVRENAGYAPIPQDNPKYRGRTFNRMLANGARGMLERMASQKLAWAGVLEIMIVSFFTSTTDTLTGDIASSQRKGEVFTPRSGGEPRHADENAVLCIGNWLFLYPLAAKTTPAPTP
jgi:hypothetical protein